jgi:methionyl-tRNA synthetase
MAKDNLPFHTILWPATLLGTRQPWKMADYIKGFNWLTYYGKKFSTSEGRGIFSDQALEILPPDYWRYALMSMAPETSDSAFTWELLQAKVNSDLADNFGNFVNRTLKLAVTNYGQTIPEGEPPGERERQLQEECVKTVGLYIGFMRDMEFRRAVDTLRALWSIGNLYIYERAPWKLVKEDRNAALLIIRTCINLVALYAKASYPFIPFTAERIFEALNMSETERMRPLTEASDLNSLSAGRSFEIPPILFRKLEEKDINLQRDRFKGREQ